MPKGPYLFTSESVSEGHPDKVADRISDTVLDAFLAADPFARVACETLVTTNRVVIAGEVGMNPKKMGARAPMLKPVGRGKPKINKALIEKLTRNAIKDIGYAQDGFHWKHCKIEILLHGQSAHIAQGVDARDNKDEGAGDQGIMFGYATNETPELMPATLQYSHNIVRLLAEARHAGKEKMIEPDAKSQVTLRYENGKPVGCTAVVVSTQHSPKVDQDDVREIVRPYVEKVLPKGWMPQAEHFHVNPTGKFEIGGPDGDTGLTGRKIIVDTYGGAAPHGGGAFSGKDPTKVDRSAAYAARYLAKNVVAAGLAERCLIQLAYAIGVAHPLSVYVDTFGTSKVDEEKLAKILPELVSLSPRGIREHLGLNKPIYARTTAYGHFGRQPDSDGGFSWERLDLVNELKSAFR